MIITWMLYGLVIGALLGGAALTAERAARALRLPARWIWALALIASIALPVVGLLAPRSDPAGTAAGIERFGGDPVVPASVPGDAVSLARAGGALAALAVRATELGRALDRPLLAAWALGSMALFAVFIAAWLRLRRARRDWSLSLVERQFVRVSTDIGPAVVGCVRSEIVLPVWALGMDPASRAMLLAHEQEHVRARDPLLLAAGLLTLALVPWNIAMWWQLRRLRLAVEMDCDARVLRGCPDVRTYGALLVEVGRRNARTPFAAAAFSEPATHLERRIRMMLTRPPRRPRLRAGALSAAAAALAIVACDLQPPTAPAPMNDVAVDALGANGQSFNATGSGVNPDLRLALGEHFPDMLTAAGGDKWLVIFVLDADGRILRASRQPEATSRVRVSGLSGDLRVTGETHAAALGVERARVAYRAEEAVEVPVGVATARLESTEERIRLERLAASAQASGVVRARTELPPAAAARERAVVEEMRLAPTAVARSRVPLTTGATLRQRSDAGGPGALDRLPADDIESIEVVKGSAVTISDAIAGVIWVRLKPGASAAREAVRRY
ncbi:MAG TPA: M56 family metallopeptidase [Gemmatimonadaceae bacterium]|nr:M56 family metallopeptidase [Gemmatimonadaceae bacterium]